MSCRLQSRFISGCRYSHRRLERHMHAHIRPATTLPTTHSYQVELGNCSSESNLFALWSGNSAGWATWRDNDSFSCDDETGRVHEACHRCIENQNGSVGICADYRANEIKRKGAWKTGSTLHWTDYAECLLVPICSFDESENESAAPSLESVAKALVRLLEMKRNSRLAFSIGHVAVLDDIPVFYSNYIRLYKFVPEEKRGGGGGTDFRPLPCHK